MVRFKEVVNNWIFPIISIRKLKRAIPSFIWYFKDWRKYSKMEGAEYLKFTDAIPCLYDKTETTSFDFHYFYQDIWAFKRIFKSKCKHHFDVGSRADLIGFLTIITKITFIDIRPLQANLENFESKKGNILSLPYKTGSISSLSCLHVAEHIGLGRYGDALDPMGTKKACKELSRVLAPGGNLFFSLPIGIPKLSFNAHRIHSSKQIFNYFSDLMLIELSGITDKGDFIQNIDEKILDSCNFGCGLFWFTKK